ncbi:uncharacterized protein BJX67DRAFT_236901 [Aspergillus lucknowensis]|uniref:Uncharacterized protein n=1 Tax=Aspergillus lucknowensis TaxID=176173 RepID=A0ABR4LGQ9_9EURO
MQATLFGSWSLWRGESQWLSRPPHGCATSSVKLHRHTICEWLESCKNSNKRHALVVERRRIDKNLNRMAQYSGNPLSGREGRGGANC